MSQAATLSPPKVSRTERNPAPTQPTRVASSMTAEILARTNYTRIPNRLKDEPTTQEGHRLLCGLLLKAREDRVAFIKDKDLGILLGGWSVSKVRKVRERVQPLGFFTRGWFLKGKTKRRGYEIHWDRFGFRNGPKSQPHGGWSPLPNTLISSSMADELFCCMEVILQYRNRELGVAFPCNQTLADELRCSLSSAKDYVTRLEALGVIGRTNVVVLDDLVRVFEVNWDSFKPCEVTASPTIDHPETTPDNYPVPGSAVPQSWPDNYPVPGHKEDSQRKDTKKTPSGTPKQAAESEAGERGDDAREVESPPRGKLSKVTRMVNDYDDRLTAILAESKQPGFVETEEYSRRFFAICKEGRKLPWRGDFPICGRDSTAAIKLEQSVRDEFSPRLATAARLWCEDVPPEWVEAVIRCKIRGNPDLISPVGLLNRVLNDCINRNECEFVVIRDQPKPWSEVGIQGIGPAAEISSANLVQAPQLETSDTTSATFTTTQTESLNASDKPQETDEARLQRERDERRQVARKMFEDAGALDYYRWFENEDRPIETLRSLLAGELRRRGQSPPAVRG